MNAQDRIVAEAKIIVTGLASGYPIDAMEGNVDELLVAMGELGHLNPNNAYAFEAGAEGRLEVINQTEGWTLLVNADTGEVSTPPADEITMPGPAATQPAPVSYYRVLVDEAAVPLFRTSRLHNVGTMLQVYRGVCAGWPMDQGFGVRVLVVLTTGAGRIMSDAELAALLVG